MNIKKQIEKFVIPQIKDSKQPPVFCLTGPMAAGKNFVAGEFEKLGFVSIDLDKEVHKVLEEVTPQIFDAFEELAKSRGLEIRTKENTLDRRALGALLFSAPDLLAKHEGIIYPALNRNVHAWINEQKKKRLINTGTVLTPDTKSNTSNPAAVSTTTTATPKGIIINATVLYKTPELLNQCDFIIYVHANWIKRFNRARRRDHMNKLQIIQRFTAQKSLLAEYKKASKKIIVIKN